MSLIPLPTDFSFTNVSKFGLDRITNTMRSRYTGQTQKVSYPYALWVFDATLVPYDGSKASAIRSFFSKLEGQKNCFRLPVPGYSLPKSNYASNLLATVAVGGGPHSIDFLDEGEYITINDELKVVTAYCPFDASGNSVITFMPPLRRDVPIGTIVYSVNPTVLLTSSDDKVASWGITPPYRHALKISAIEEITTVVYPAPTVVTPIVHSRFIDGGNAFSTYS
jgi:hypothetical protein